MLRVGLSGGIGSGKSTVSQRFAELGALVVDADLLAREVVAPGSAGLVAVHGRFGDGVIAADGSLDRPALGAVVFGDRSARRDLEQITHPLIAARTQERMTSAPPEQIIVHDIPLLVEKQMAASYHLVAIVGADAEVRVGRLTGDRGMTGPDALARIAAQADDVERRAVADAWLDNNGSREHLLDQVDALWHDRLTGFNDNLLTGDASRRPETLILVPYDDAWPPQAARLVGRFRKALGERCTDVQHIGSTSVPGLIAKDVIDLQVGMRHLPDADGPALVEAMASIGFPRSPGNDHDDSLPWLDEQDLWHKRFHHSADPGRVAHVHVRQVDEPGWRYAQLFRDWLRANSHERDAYARAKHKAAAQTRERATAYAQAKGPWIMSALRRADAWADRTGWTETMTR